MTPQTEVDKGTAQKMYERLAVHREPYLRRARDVAKYTIPPEVPPEGANGSTEFYKPYQGMGARCVNNLSSRFMLTLLPPTRRFFRLTLDEETRKGLEDAELQEFETALSNMEETVVRRMEKIGLRIHAAEAILHMVMTGNALLFVGPKYCKTYRIWQYVLRRDSEGNILDLVVKESVSPDELPEEMQPHVQAHCSRNQADVDLYTYVWREESGTYRVKQECFGLVVPGSEGSYGKTCPWIAMRWKRDGGDWSRSYCDDYIGDLISCEALSRSIVRFAAIAAKVLLLVKPNSTLDVARLNEAEEGEYVEGDPEDVAPIKFDKYPDFQIARATLEDINGRLAYAFLLNSAIRRQGERVTAEEIRYMAAELEDALGGVYSVQSLELLLPIARVLIQHMTKDGTLPQLPKDKVVPTIVTGLDALGRSHELARLEQFIGGAAELLGPGLMEWIDVTDYLRRRALGLDLVNPDALIRTKEQVDQSRQQMQAAEVVKAAAPNATKAIADATMQGTTPNG